MIKIAVLTFSAGVSHDKYIEDSLQTLIKWLKGKPNLEVLYSKNIIGNVKTAIEETKKLTSQDVDCLLFFIPEWTFPNLIVEAATTGNLPVLLFSPLDPGHAGLIGMIASSAALNQLGIKNVRIWGRIGEDETLSKIMIDARATHVIKKLRGKVLGLFGGYPMGIYTATVDPLQVYSIFGVDIKHIDQLEIVKRAERIHKDEIDKAYEWLRRMVKKIYFDGQKLTEDALKKQIGCYLAVKEIVEEEQLDFIAFKCHPELSGGYCTQCLTQAFMNDPYDWNGNKKIIPTACEADIDGAITMEILHLLTNQPVSFFDLRHFSRPDKLLTFMNCGSQSTWFAKKSNNPSENLNLVSLYPQIFKAGGASLQFQCHPGEITLARLTRIKGEYVMQIAKGEFIKRSMEEMKQAVYSWPQGFVKLKADPEEFLTEVGSNHLHAVYGDWVNDLIKISNNLAIKYKVFD
jgi:L-fucose isomerase